MRWRRPQISLLNGLLLMTIFGMSVVVVQFWRTVEPLREQNQTLRVENKRLNEERGTLVIEEPEKLNAIGIPGRFAGEGRTSFRVYVPPGQNYVVYCHVNNVPKAGLPAPLTPPGRIHLPGVFKGRMYAGLDPGEHTVTVRTLRFGKQADISLAVSFNDPKITLDANANTPSDRWPTVVPETYTNFGDGVSSKTVAVDGKEPLVLLRRRIMAEAADRNSYSYATIEPNMPLDGVMLWLEKVSN